MGMLVNGTWFDDDQLPADRGGAFLRPDSSFRDRVSRDGSSGFQSECGRYQLVTAPSCPWAHRTVLMRALKRLDGVVPLLESDLPKGEGWAYSRGSDDLAPKNGVFHVHQVYTAARQSCTAPSSFCCRSRLFGRRAPSARHQIRASRGSLSGKRAFRYRVASVSRPAC
jgi:putative glutathione S-transferase